MSAYHYRGKGVVSDVEEKFTAGRREGAEIIYSQK
jgi:hypothetical protein